MKIDKKIGIATSKITSGGHVTPAILQITDEYYEEKYRHIVKVNHNKCTVTFYSWTSCWDGMIGESSYRSKVRDINLSHLFGHGSRIPVSLKNKKEMYKGYQVWYSDGYIMKTVIKWDSWHNDSPLQEHIRRMFEENGWKMIVKCKRL